MNVVTRNTIDFNLKDQPCINLEINGSLFLIHFNKSLHFLKPSNYKAISTNNISHNHDLRVHKSTWWIVTDIGTDTCSEISSTWNGQEEGFRISYVNTKTETSVSFRITESESNDILGYIETMILRATVDTGGCITKQPVLIYQPSLKSVEYRSVSNSDPPRGREFGTSSPCNAGGRVSSEVLFSQRGGQHFDTRQYRVTPLQYIHTSAMPFLSSGPLLTIPSKSTTKKLNTLYKIELPSPNGMHYTITV